MKRLLAALVVLAVAVSIYLMPSARPAVFQPIRLEQTSGQLLGVTYPNQTCEALVFQKFRTSLGTLDEVRIGLKDAYIRTLRRYENRSPFTCQYSAGVTLSGSPMTPAMLNMILYDGSNPLTLYGPPSLNIQSHSLQPFDGVEDYQGPSSATWDDIIVIPESELGIYQWVSSDPADLAAWTGNGTKTLDLCSEDPVYGYDENTCGLFSRALDNWIGATVFVEYTYH